MEHLLIDEFVREYESERLQWQALAEYTKDVFQEGQHLPPIHAQISYRAKDVTKVREKIRKLIFADPSRYRTSSDVWENIYDLAGVRIALYTPSEQQIEAVVKIIEKEFPGAVPVESPGKGLHRFHTFNLSNGYKAYHYRVTVGDRHIGGLKNKANYHGISRPRVVEVQVISAMRHAVSEATHDICYKPQFGDPSLHELVLLDSLYMTADIQEKYLFELWNLHFDRVGASHAKFTSKYDLGWYLSRRFSANPMTESINPGPMGVLLDLLQTQKMDSPKALEQCLVDIDFNQMPQDYPVKSRASLYIMDRIIHQPIISQEKFAHQAPTGEKCQIMASSLLLLDRLFPPTDNWHWRNPLHVDSMDAGQKDSLVWLMSVARVCIDKMDVVVLNHEIDLERLWSWFCDHESKVVQFTFTLAHLGVWKDIGPEFERLESIWTTICEGIGRDI